MNSFPHAQIDNHSRAGEALTMGRRVGDCGYRPAHVGQGGHHSVFVGGSVLHNGSARCLTTSLNWLGAVATKPSLFHSRIASRLPPSGRGDRRRVNAGLLPCVRLVATQFMHGVMAPCSHSHFSIGHKLGGYRADLLEVSHLERPFKSASSDTWNHSGAKRHNVGTITQGLGNV